MTGIEDLILRFFIWLFTVDEDGISPFRAGLALTTFLLLAGIAGGIETGSIPLP